MIKLKDIEINDKKWIDPLIAAANFRGCHQNFTNMFAWTEVYKYEVAQVEGFLVVKENSESLAPHFYFPAGTGDLKSVIETMKADAEERQHPFSLIGLSVENVEALRQILSPTALNIRRCRIFLTMSIAWINWYLFPERNYSPNAIISTGLRQPTHGPLN